MNDVHNQMQSILRSAYDAVADMNVLAKELLSEERRVRGADAAKAEIGAALEDGRLTKDEVEAILADLEALGVDVSDLRAQFAAAGGHDSVVDASSIEGSRFADALRDTADDFANQSDRTFSDLAFGLKWAQTREARAIGAVSSLRKPKHQAAMNVIGNMKA